MVYKQSQPLLRDNGFRALSLECDGVKAPQKITSIPNPHYARGNTRKHATSGGAHLHYLAPGLLSSEETSQQWGAVGDTVPIGLARELNPRPPSQ